MGKVKILPDENPTDPREWDNLGVMVCVHRRYNLGDEHLRSVEEVDEWLKTHAPKGSVILPLYLYDHSGITMSTSPFKCPWDSGQVGYIVATPEAIRAAFCKKRITKKIRARVEECLRAEVETYDQYLRGDVWGYVAQEDTGEEDSCWGFYGDKLEDTGILDSINPSLHELAKEAWENRYSG